MQRLVKVLRVLEIAMAWRDETEDGLGWGFLVQSKAERIAEERQAALEKDAQRYRKWRADYTSHADVQISDLLLALADAWTADEVDAAIDSTPAVGAA